MIIRGNSQAQYTHDDEALVAEWRTPREFAGVSVGVMLGWIEDAREFGWSKDYWHILGSEWFETANKFLYGRTPDVVTVTLWRRRDFTDHVVRAFGFSCVACGARSAFEERGKLYGDENGLFVEEAVRDRQTVWAPPLICRECAIDLPVVFSPFIPERKAMMAIERLIGRAVPLAISGVAR